MKEFGREGRLCWADGGIERMEEERIGIQREKKEGLCLQDGRRERMENEGIGLERGSRGGKVFACMTEERKVSRGENRGKKMRRKKSDRK